MGLPIVRIGDLCTGHECYPGRYPPRPNVGGSSDVLINGIGAHRMGDPWATHCCGISCHAAVTETSSATVFVNGRGVARIGDGVSCGSRCLGSSSNVFAG